MRAGSPRSSTSAQGTLSPSSSPWARDSPLPIPPAQTPTTRVFKTPCTQAFPWCLMASPPWAPACWIQAKEAQQLHGGADTQEHFLPHPSHKESSTQGTRGNRSSTPTEGCGQHEACVTHPNLWRWGDMETCTFSPIAIMLDTRMVRTGGSSPVPVFICISSSETSVQRHEGLRPSACRIARGGKALLAQLFKGLQLLQRPGVTCVSKQLREPNKSHPFPA